MAATMSIILRALTFLGLLSVTQSTLSDPAPGWQSAQSYPSAAATTPMEPRKSSTLRLLRDAVVTLLKNSPAGVPLATAAPAAAFPAAFPAAGALVAVWPFGAAWPCAAARPTNANPISPARATPEIASAASLDRSLM